MSNITSPRKKTLASPAGARSSPVKAKAPNWDWLGVAPEEPRSRLPSSTLVALSSPVNATLGHTFGVSDNVDVGKADSGEPEISNLDQTLLKHEFRDGQFVWVKLDTDMWVRGYIYGKLRTRQQMARTCTFETFWPVVCGTSHIAWFSPANGNIKPDTPRVRELLRQEYDMEI